MKTENATFSWDGGTVSGVWHHPSRGSDYVILAHGAGGNMDTPQLKAYAEQVAVRDLGAVRFNFAYAEAKKKAPDRTDKLEACYRAVATEVSKQAKRLFIGGRSMGGRIGSHIVAQGFPVDGLIFLAYPLHPPGKPERIRDEHLKTITVPMLFLQGSRDPFARSSTRRSRPCRRQLCTACKTAITRTRSPGDRLPTWSTSWSARRSTGWRSSSSGTPP